MATVTIEVSEPILARLAAVADGPVAEVAWFALVEGLDVMEAWARFGGTRPLVVLSVGEDVAARWAGLAQETGLSLAEWLESLAFRAENVATRGTG